MLNECSGRSVVDRLSDIAALSEDVAVLVADAVEHITKLERQVAELRPWALNGLTVMAARAANGEEYGDIQALIARIESGEFGESK
jgi:hypothetical protein